MEKVINKKDDLVVDAIFYFESVQRFEYRCDMFSFGVPVTARAQEFYSSYRDDIFVFAAGLSKVSYNSLI